MHHAIKNKRGPFPGQFDFVSQRDSSFSISWFELRIRSDQIKGLFQIRRNRGYENIRLRIGVHTHRH